MKKVSYRRGKKSIRKTARTEGLPIASLDDIARDPACARKLPIRVLAALALRCAAIQSVIGVAMYKEVEVFAQAFAQAEKSKKER